MFKEKNLLVKTPTRAEDFGLTGDRPRINKGRQSLNAKLLVTNYLILVTI
jgi:hypothetical protein